MSSSNIQEEAKFLVNGYLVYITCKREGKEEMLEIHADGNIIIEPEISNIVSIKIKELRRK